MKLKAVFGLLGMAFECLALLLLQVGTVRAADATPADLAASMAWMSIESASAQASSADSVHALVSSVVRQRQLNPLRAARLFATVRVAQAEATRQLSTLPADLVAAMSASQALNWMLPLEDPARWVSPALYLSKGAADLTVEDLARIDVAIAPALSHALDDRADARRRPLVKPEPKPGFWLRTPPLFAEQPTEPQGANWLPWCSGSDRVEVAPPVLHGSSNWQEELHHVAAVTKSLTSDQKSIAQRWHLDAGSITPPGVWNAIVTSYLVQYPQPAVKRQRVLAVLNMAMQDALVAAWRIKLKYWSERPITAIRRELDPAFEPLLITPPFPGYVSGHSAVSAAAAGVLSHYFPEQRSQWYALAREAAVSRLYGGIHFASDNEQGMALGHLVAQSCLAAFESNGEAGNSELVTAQAGRSFDFFALPRMRVLPE